MPGINDNRILLACGKVNTDGTKLSGYGATPARTGAGVYTLTLGGPGVPEGEEELLVSNNSAAGQIQIQNTSATVKGVTSFAADGTTATDKKFSFEIWQIIPGT
jgi:hypothetical protein